ncbi:MAG: hypothetical protein R3C19_21600 [Planctomycetaceae bacterium]
MISVQVNYTDGGGTLEVLTSDAIGPVGGSTNSPPTGEPVITGTPTEDQTLSVDVSSIADADGLGPFTYLWSTGATTPTITLGDTEVGTEIFVTVFYNDGNGTLETLTSASVRTDR